MDKGYDVYEYSRRGDLESLREALDSGMKPDDYMAYDGSTALVMAARSGHSHIVKELLARGGDSQVRTEDGSTLLHHAASGNSAEAIDLLIKSRIDANTVNEDGVSPIILAAHYGHMSCVSALCSGGADINLSAEGWGTPLDGAEGEVAKFLESKGAKRSAGGADQPLAAAHERFSYGCFETGENPHSTPVLAPKGDEANDRKPQVGDSVRLRFAKPSGMLREGDVGVVVADDGSDCVPLKVTFGERYDYYEYRDLKVCEPAEELPQDSDHATEDGTKRFLVRKKLEKRFACNYLPNVERRACQCTSANLAVKCQGEQCERWGAPASVSPRSALAVIV
ncbi:ANK1 [Symbiodinium natans]|uniref:ANK1 protein n=1 Tax=Symbiodinium natans TaxID=878477 RepID=A0A812P0V0_9DINO|nr:ANK1 [Symbiodinium natans]